MIRCSCCGTYTVEEFVRDLGNGPQRLYRLKQQAPHGGTYVIAEAATLDDLAVVLDERGILMWPSEDDGCE